MRLRCSRCRMPSAQRRRPSNRRSAAYDPYVEGKDDTDVVNDLVQGLGAKRVDSGANLVLAVPKDPFVLYQSRAAASQNDCPELYHDERPVNG